MKLYVSSQYLQLLVLYQVQYLPINVHHLIHFPNDIITVITLLLEQICFLYIPLSDVEILEHRRKKVVNFPKNTISFSNCLKWSSLNCKNFSSLPAAGRAFSGIFIFLCLFWDEAICQKRWRVHLVTFRMWVTPLLFSSSKLDAFHSLVGYQRYIFYDCMDKCILMNKSWQKWSEKLIQTTFPRKESQRSSRQGPSAPESTESPRQWKPAEL